MPTPVVFQDLGLMDYKACWELQEQVFQSIVDQKVANRSLPDSERQWPASRLYFVEHPHVYTLGKSGDLSHLLLDEEALKRVDASFYAINRGGD
ncbi:MAG: lipoyl protein ligase domain-containing protein, partial [Flavobacteriales bacterium]